MSRTGRGARASPPAISISIAIAARIVDRAVADPVGLAFGPAGAEMVPMGEEEQVLARGAAAAQPADHIVAGIAADVGLDVRCGADGQGDGAEGGAGLIVEQPRKVAARRGKQRLRRRLRHRADHPGVGTPASLVPGRR